MSTTNPTDVSTEWEQLQIKYGNFPERPKPITNEAVTNMAIDLAEQQDILDTQTLADLEKIEDDIDEETLMVYRKRRLEELKRKREAFKFGELIHVGKSDYVKEVTEASKDSPNQVVVIHLYSDRKPICCLINRALEVVAKRHGEVKFCKGIGSDVIQNFPDSRVPTVLVYKNGTCAQQFLGGSIWGGEHVTPDSVEWVLWKNNFVASAEVEEDPRRNSRSESIALKMDQQGNDYFTHISPDRSDEDDDDSTEEQRNSEKRGYTSLHMEKALRLK